MILLFLGGLTTCNLRLICNFCSYSVMTIVYSIAVALLAFESLFMYVSIMLMALNKDLKKIKSKKLTQEYRNASNGLHQV